MKGIEPFPAMLWLLLLNWSTSFSMSVLILGLAVKWERVFKPYVLVVFLYIVSCFSSLMPESLVSWFPGNQGIYLRHSEVDGHIHHFSVWWSLIYNAMIIVCVFLWGMHYIKKADVSGQKNSNELQ
ncbi:hypothetical protein [Thermoactinomyces sp. CICC 10521]|uniref:hypothetical protein n=1 Tax=Thermoactinomyces sp. CICC 10521 TaxID=2767426 RepID=UPI0018DCFB18|nr:hypothetical protein [Thermoactinomyces sp. CICC 10521]MBH8607759.1 hypothetical protein [Thermoactinomyces sp. CICC 10521]